MNLKTKYLFKGLKVDGKRIFYRNRFVGVIRNDKTLMLFRSKKKHYFRNYDGWALTKIILDFANDIGIKFVEIKVKETQRIWKTQLINFYLYGIYYKNPKIENDVQLVLNKKYWVYYPERIRKKQISLKEVIE